MLKTISQPGEHFLFTAAAATVVIFKYNVFTLYILYYQNAEIPIMKEDETKTLM